MRCAFPNSMSRKTETATMMSVNVGFVTDLRGSILFILKASIGD